MVVSLRGTRLYLPPEKKPTMIPCLAKILSSMALIFKARAITTCLILYLVSIQILSSAALLPRPIRSFSHQSASRIVPMIAVKDKRLNRLSLSTVSDENKPTPPTQKIISSFGNNSRSGTVLDSSPSGLVKQMERLMECDFGLTDADLLDDLRFRSITPQTVAKPLNKVDYLAAGRFFNLRGTFPDLEYNPYHYRIDTFPTMKMNDDESLITVRCTCRVRGTMMNELRLRDETLPPTEQIMICPPEAVSVTFDKKTGKVVKLCTGFVMDRFVGNTKGTTGVLAAAVVAGMTVSAWQVQPPAVVLRRLLTRPDKPVAESNTESPFPEVVMAQLARGILSTSLAYDDPSLLSDDFTFSTPYIGPVKKPAFLEKYAQQEFLNGAIEPILTNFRIDPFHPVRVWVDVQPVSVQDNYIGTPQCMSFTFDEDGGYCTRITSRYIIDPTIGNGNGYDGLNGYYLVTGQRPLDVFFSTRPIAQMYTGFRNNAIQLLSREKDDNDQDSTVAFDTNPEAVRKRLALLKESASAGDNLSTLGSKSSPLGKLSTSSMIAPEPPTAPPTDVDTSSEIDAAKSNLFFLTEEKSGAAAAAESILPVLEGIQKTATESIQAIPAIQSSIRSFLTDRQQDWEDMKRKQEEEALLAAKKRQEAQQSNAQSKDAGKSSKKEMGPEEDRKKRLAEKEAAARKLDIEKKQQEIAAAAKRKAEEVKKKKEEEAKAEQERAREQAEKKKKEDVAGRFDFAAARQAKATPQQDSKSKNNNNKQTPPLQQSAENVKQLQDAAIEALSSAASRATISLFGASSELDDGVKPDRPPLSRILGRGGAKTTKTTTKKTSPKKTTTKKATKAQAPAGVATIYNWRQMSDGTVKGRIRDAKGFDNGQTIQTSPIKRGKIASGEVVSTSSGTRYFLQ